MFVAKIDRLTPKQITYFHLVYEMELPMVVVCQVMDIKKSQYYNLKRWVDEELKKQERRYIFSCNST